MIHERGQLPSRGCPRCAAEWARRMDPTPSWTAYWATGPLTLRGPARHPLSIRRTFVLHARSRANRLGSRPELPQITTASPKWSSIAASAAQDHVDGTCKHNASRGPVNRRRSATAPERPTGPSGTGHRHKRPSATSGSSETPCKKTRARRQGGSADRPAPLRDPRPATGCIP